VTKCDSRSSVQTEPEFVQWTQDLMKTWCQAKRVIKKGPKVINMQRSVAGDANYNKVITLEFFLLTRYLSSCHACAHPRD